MIVHLIVESLPIDIQEAWNRTHRLLKIQKKLKKHASDYHKGGKGPDVRKSKLDALRAAGALSRGVVKARHKGKKKGHTNDKDTDSKFRTLMKANKLESRS